MTGSSGLIGSALVSLLSTQGHAVTRLVRTRHQSKEREVLWDPDSGTIESAALEGLDAVVHLAGESLASGRWTPERKARIRDSRVKGTRLLCESLAQRSRPPNVFVVASAIGYYGHRGDELLTEQSPKGIGFLADLCEAWEGAAAPAVQQGIRVVHVRFGIVLSAVGGALAKMVPPFRLGLGGRLGNGQQYMSWVAIDDVVGAILHALATEQLTGPVNIVAPAPVTNAEFTTVLGRVLSRPTIFPVPRMALRLLFGEFADEALLASARVVPTKLLATRYAFRFSSLDDALRHVLQNTRT